MGKKIILYDAKCSFCQKCKNFIQRRSSVFYMVNIHSKEAMEFLKKFKINPNQKENFNKIYLFTNQKIYSEGAAVAEICFDLKFPYPIFYFCSLIFPNFILNFFYRIIAKNRHHL